MIESVAPCVNIDSLIAHFREELQRERDRVAVERNAASSAREALAACEERAKLEREGRLAALGDANRYAVERDNAVAELERHKADRRDLIAQRNRMVEDLQRELEHRLCDAKDAQQMLMDARKRNAEPALTPGTPTAVIEAVRLLTGHVAEVQPKNGGTEAYWCTPCDYETECAGNARMALLGHLEELQPAAMVKT